MLLLADDDSTIVFATSLFLRNLGWEVVTAEDGEQACKLAHQHVGMLQGVILDINMPGKSGIDALHYMHALQPDLAAILVTGYPDNPGLMPHLEKEHVVLLEKPFPLRKLANAIKDLVENPAAVTVQPKVISKD